MAKKIEIRTEKADFLDCEYFYIYDVMQLLPEGGHSHLASYLEKGMAVSEAKSCEEINGITTIIEPRMVWLS